MSSADNRTGRLDESRLDETFSGMVTEDLVPGLVAFARVGNDTYCKAFGVHDKATNAPMQENAIFRFYSNSKVFGGAVALDLQAQGKLSLEDPVSKYIPSFGREWSVLREDDNGSQTVEVFDAIAQESKEFRYSSESNGVQMQVKHLLSETSGIGYDMSRGDASLACNTLRELAAAPELYFTSRRIVGSSLSVEGFCDVIAKAGVLSQKPGTPSYGHGATVFGRIVEVIENAKLSDFLSESLFKPCGMEAQFFFADGDSRAARLPAMYAPTADENGEGYTMVPCQQTVPGSTNHRDHFAGPRACESLDTGLSMPVASYAKFFDMLINKGRTPDGKQILDEAAVHSLTHGQTSLGAFSHGWEVQPCSITTDEGTRITTVCTWGGYAATRAFLFPDEGAYVILGQQIMSYTPAAAVVQNLREKQTKNMLSALLGDVAWGDQMKKASA